MRAQLRASRCARTGCARSAELRGGGWHRILLLAVVFNERFVVGRGLATSQLDRYPQHAEGHDGDEQLIPSAGLAMQEKGHVAKRVPTGSLSSPRMNGTVILGRPLRCARSLPNDETKRRVVPAALGCHSA